jgi:UDP:flavonoid glycosyltransferase YjiC (YdhE family)
VELLIATWQAGGATQVAIELGRTLRRRGHHVRIFAPAELAGRIGEAGCVHRPFPPGIGVNPRRPAEDQWEALRRVWFGRELAEAFMDELARERADAVVVDYLLRSLTAAVELVDARSALLVHTIYGFHGGADDDGATRRRWYEPVNAARAELGLEPLPTDRDSVTVALVRRAGAAIVVMPREFDDWPDPPGNVVHVGPITDASSDDSWDPPWSDDDERPFVVVTLGTTYMAHEAVLGRIAEALDPGRFRVLICTGTDLPLDAIQMPAGVEVRAYVPHGAVLPSAAAVVTHAGTGTLLAAFAAGVPVVCLPLGRDQPANARRVAELGLGSSLSPESPPTAIRAAVDQVLADRAMSRRTRNFAETMRTYHGGIAAAAVVEALTKRSPSAGA